MRYGTLTSDDQHQQPHQGTSTHESSATTIDISNYDINKNSPSSQQNQTTKILSHCHIQDSNNDLHEANRADLSARRRLTIASIICLLFMITEIIGGVLSNSLAIAADAAHLLTDLASFMVSLFALILTSRPASKRMSFGWYRAEVIGALLSVFMIWLVTMILVYMAVERLRSGQYDQIDSTVMVITATAGLLVNILMAIALHSDGHGHSHFGHSHGHGHGHDHEHNPSHGQEHYNETSSLTSTPARSRRSVCESKEYLVDPKLFVTVDRENSIQKSLDKKQLHSLNEDLEAKCKKVGKTNINVRAAFIHIIGDFLQSLGVLIAALIIHFKPEYAVVDPICTFLFSFLVLITTVRIIKEATNVLMEGMPEGVNFIEVREKLQRLPGVVTVHNLRIWSLSMDKIAVSTHLVIENGKPSKQVLKNAINLLKNNYQFFEVTIQIEEYGEDMKDCQHCQEDDEAVRKSSSTASSSNHLD